jgi:cytoskeletal protein RodZ
MKKNNIFQKFKNINIIKILILILLVFLIIAILLYNKNIFEAMTINIYTNKEDYKINEEKSSDVTPYDNSNKYNENSNGLEETNSTSPEANMSETTNTPSETITETETSQTNSAKDNAKDNAIKNKSSKYTEALVGPLKQTQNEDI